jgi:hypothetical protein
VQCGLFTHNSVPVIFEPPCNFDYAVSSNQRKGIEEIPPIDITVNRAEGCNCSE